VNQRTVNGKFPLWPSVSWVAVLALLLTQTPVSAATLTQGTLAAWEAYVQAARSRLEQSLQPGRRFLSIDEDKSLAAKIRAGEPVVLPSDRTPQRVPSGLIHDWEGIAFIPNAQIDDVLSVVRDYAHYTEFYHPGVLNCKVAGNSGLPNDGLLNNGLKDRFSMLLVNKTLVSRTALDGDYESSYVRLDDHRWYSISEATRIQEIENYGMHQQHTLSEHEGTGLIWKLLSITRFEQRDGGVYIELQALALSRDIPSSFRWVVTPIVRRISRASLLSSLQQTSEAVYSRNSIAVHTASSERHISASPTGTSASAVSSFH